MLFIDASGDGNFEKGKNQNILRDSDIERIVNTYQARQNEDKYSYVASFDEIKENDFNLNIPGMWIPLRKKNWWISMR